MIALSTGTSAESVRDRGLRECWPTVLAALEEAADARIERIEVASCLDCVRSSDGLCETHRNGRACAEEHQRTADALAAVWGE